MYVFGLRTEEVQALRNAGSYDPAQLCRENRRFGRVLESLSNGFFSPDEPGLFCDLRNEIASPHDPYVHFADLGSYIETMSRIASDYTDRPGWTRKAVLNVARMGKFSSDRTVMQYANEIWGITPIPVE